MGPLINERAVGDRMAAALERAQEEGGKVLYGGAVFPDVSNPR